MVSLEEKIRDIIGRIEKGIQASFSDFNKEGQDKSEMIVNFLAVLELARRGLVIVNQEDHFGNISIIKA